MPELSRDPTGLGGAGARFFRGDDGSVQFEFILDSRSKLGPRAATKRDQVEHPGAWGTFVTTEGLDPLDRDAKEGAGGSLPKAGAPRPRVKNDAAEHHQNDS